MPLECSSKGSLSLLQELCSIATSILKKKGTGSQPKFQPVFYFLTEFVNVHGGFVERKAQEALKGWTVSQGPGDVSVLLSDLLLAAVDELQTSSATESVSNADEQGQGQPPFESKTLPVPKTDTLPGDEFCGMFRLFRTCIERCPCYFFQLPSAPGLEGQEDSLHRKATDTAVGCLNEPDPQIAKHAMDFLEAMVRRNSHAQKLLSIMTSRI